MDTFLLATKLRIPPQYPHTVRRTRLTDALERGIPDHKLILISAPVGYGKTTLLAQWAHSSNFPVAWLSISNEDNSLERFLRYLLTAWEAIQPGVMESRLGLLLSAMMPDSQAVLSAFINLANDAPTHTVFILDDYHLIEDSSIHQALTFLLDHLPPSLHFVLVSRVEPPLPLARYRARQELLELRAENLQFLGEETTDFFEMMGLNLSGDEVMNLQDQLEGWVAGLQLAALSRQQRLAGADRLVVSGKHRFIADYLSEDVLASLKTDKRQFLLQTSILDSLCGPLCDAVTGRADSQEMLEAVERENLFLVPLDDSRQWFRYHRLFADFLREELKRRHSAELDRLHNNAARWYLAHDLPEQAFHHAVEGLHAELVIQLFERYLFVKIFSGESKVAMHWLNSLPERWYSDYPLLGLDRAASLVATGALEAGIRRLDEVEQQLMLTESEDASSQLARVTAVRCFIACFRNDLPSAEEYGYQALQDLPEEDLSFRADTYHALGDTYRGNGRWDEAEDFYLKVFDFDQPTFSVRPAHVYGALADLVLRQGRLRDAANHWKKALQAIQEVQNWGRLPLPLIGWVYLRMGELLYEWNELADAWDHLSRGLERAELGGDIRALIAGYLIAGRFKLTENDIEGSVDFLERARPLVEKTHFPDWTSRFDRFQLELWLAQSQLRTAIDWATEMLHSHIIEERPESEIAQLAIARVMIIKEDSSSNERTLKLLKRLHQTAEVQGRRSIQIEALALQALAYWKRGERVDAMMALERALRLAEPEGYVRLFVDLGLPMARLLQEAHSRGVLQDYVAKLLVAFGTELSAFGDIEDGIPDPLTPREQEILELVAAGLTNLEIANKLFISSETVKKHTGSIYSKLSVSNRTEAVARARELDLLV
jgi:LuxR family transcriptional regulator, maltose regulon positive regulatory protein